MSCAAKNDDKIDVMTLNRIVGGNHGAYAPYQVFFVYMLNKSKHISWCGGTILNKRFILTAKHCVYNSHYKTEVNPKTAMIKVVVGEVNWCKVIGLDKIDVLFQEGSKNISRNRLMSPIFTEKFDSVKDVSEVIVHGTPSEWWKDDLAILKVIFVFVLFVVHLI